MKVMKFVALAFFALLVQMAFADSQEITFTNNDGKIKSNQAQTTLSLVGSTLFAVQGMNNSFGSGYDCALNCGPGSTVAFTTGQVIGTFNAKGVQIATTLFPLSVPNGTQTTTFGATGSNGFMVTENPGGGVLGFTFSGGFSSESWACATGQTCQAAIVNGQHGFTGTWFFQGTILNGTLTVDGHQYTVPTAATVDLTTTKGFVKNPGATGVITFTDSQGTTNFMSPVPEPSTLALFGTGLIALGLLTKRVTSGRTQLNNC